MYNENKKLEKIIIRYNSIYKKVTKKLDRIIKEKPHIDPELKLVLYYKSIDSQDIFIKDLKDYTLSNTDEETPYICLKSSGEIIVHTGEQENPTDCGKTRKTEWFIEIPNLCQGEDNEKEIKICCKAFSEDGEEIEADIPYDTVIENALNSKHDFIMDILAQYRDILGDTGTISYKSDQTYEALCGLYSRFSELRKRIELEENIYNLEERAKIKREIDDRWHELRELLGLPLG